MHLSQEIETIFDKLKTGRIDPEVARSAIEHLISAHVRKPSMHLDESIRSALDRLRQHAADYAVIEAEIMAWISLRTDIDARAVVWL
jgi:hypothetical protein